METHPEIDVQKAADEVKRFLDEKKFEMVDWNYWNIEAYPDPRSEDMPELSKFAGMWAEVFDYADTVTLDDGTGFPEEIIRRYESLTGLVAERVNADSEYWTILREEIMPLYKAPTDRGEWPELEAFKANWPRLRDKVFSDDEGLMLVNTATTMDDMRILLESYNAFGAKAKAVFMSECNIDMPDEKFRVMIKSYADQMVLENWRRRWTGVKIFYDPIPMDVTTTQMWTNKITGEKTRGDVLGERNLPAGFVVKIL